MKWPSVRTAIVVGLTLRLLAAVYSQGYAMHDDHFVIEDGPYRWFLPDHGGWFDRAAPPGHSVAYPAMLFGLLTACTGLGITDPQTQMLVMRLLHALFATLAIPLAAAIARRVGTEESARAAAFLVAVFWILPFLSVRNLIEVVCIPPLMLGTFLVIRRQTIRDVIVAGLAFSIAFMFRYHTAILPATFIVVLAYQREWRMNIVLGLSFVICISLTQGLIDLAVWGRFLAAPLTYWQNFVTGTDQYTQGPFYQYAALLVGLLLPPASLMLLWKVFTDKRPALRFELVLPIVLFVIAHSFIANKQERFIIPILPLLVVAVAVAWTDRPTAQTSSAAARRWSTALWWWFWIFNSILLALFTFSYSKRSRVESLTYLSHLPNVKLVAVIARDGVFVPSFYLGRGIPHYTVSTDTTSTSWDSLHARTPTHVVFYDITSRDLLLSRVDSILPGRLEALTEVDPGLLDATLHWLNPKGNKNETSVVYRVTNDK
ncbi:MAG: glycosyltransferase family 39 protein [Candidatus Kapabacteria bacterium]|nr:glycosyltransferase family 39 protein [Candidatus Kapabacteria bacterium]